MLSDREVLDSVIDASLADIGSSIVFFSLVVAVWATDFGEHVGAVTVLVLPYVLAFASLFAFPIEVISLVIASATGSVVALVRKAVS